MMKMQSHFFEAILRNIQDLVWCIYWTQITCIYWVNRPRCRENIFLLVAAPHVSFCESCLFCGNRHILASFGCVQPVEKPTWFPVYFMNHPPICQLNSGWGHCVWGGWGTELKGTRLVLNSQVICSVIRRVMFWLKSWSHLIWVSARQDKYWTFWYNSIKSELCNDNHAKCYWYEIAFPLLL
jgi:hypothetical protein